LILSKNVLKSWKKLSSIYLKIFNMKKLFFVLFLVLISTSIFSQTPEKLNYQAVVRDGSGAVVADQQVGVQVNIIEGALPGTVVYTETFALSTNNFGLINLAVGAGSVQTGVFADIDWSTGTYFLNVKVDAAGGSSYTDMGTVQLLSVPYALYAKEAGNAFSGNYNDLTNKPVLDGDVIGATDANTVIKIQGKDVSTNTPANGQVLKWNNVSMKWEPADDQLGAAGTTDGVVTGASFTGTTTKTLTLIRSNGLGEIVAEFTDNVNDADADPNNELQTLSIAGNELTISSRNTVTLPQTVYTAGSGISVSGSQIINIAPDQAVTLTGSGSTVIGGAYPNFTISTTDQNTTYQAGSGITLNGTEIVNASPDQTVAIASGTGISVSGTYPNFTIANTNPDQTVTLTGTGSTTITGTYPNFTITSTDNNTTYTAGSGLLLSGSQFSANFGTVAGTVAEGDHTHPGGSGNPAGNNGEVQFNNSGAFGASSSLFWDNDNQRMGLGLNNPEGRMVVKANSLAPVTEPLFEVKNRAGQTVFVVYEDSVRIYVDDDQAKANKGTFAVSGRNSSKNFTNDYLVVRPDSTRIFTGNENAGFGVLNIGTTETQSYVRLNPYNYYIGQEVAENENGARYNSIMGYQSARNLTTGWYNVFMGYHSGYNTSIGGENTAVGSFALFSNTDGFGNVAVGHNSMYFNTSGANNTSLGRFAMFSNTVGSYNTAVGINSMRLNTIGDRNSSFGAFSLYLNTEGDDNTSIGTNSLNMNTTGNNNTAIGSGALYRNTVGHYNVAIGAFTLEYNEASYNTAIGNFALNSNTTGAWNTALGESSLRYNTTGSDNIAVGFSALMSNETGLSNSAFGNYALILNTTGSYNTALGSSAMYVNTTGYENTAIGVSAMLNNTTGRYNTAIGMNSLAGNQTGNSNIAIGRNAMYQAGSGSSNVAIGNLALYLNTASENVAIGDLAMRNNSSGYSNTAIGKSAMVQNTSGSNNLAVGNLALYANSTGNHNLAVGPQALFNCENSSENVAVGYNALFNISSGNENTAIGKDAGPLVAGSGLWSTVAIGFNSRPTADYQAIVGNVWMTEIGGYAGWSNLSDGRFKTDVKQDVHGLDFILKLEPVSYNLNIKDLTEFIGDKYDEEAAIRSGKENIRYTGFIAQDVEKVASEINFNFSGIDKPKNSNDHYSLRYAEFVVPVVKAIQEQQLMIEELKKENKELKERLDKIENK
jgi:hypothetical protein